MFELSDISILYVHTSISAHPNILCTSTNEWANLVKANSFFNTVLDNVIRVVQVAALRSLVRQIGWDIFREGRTIPRYASPAEYE